LYFRTANFGVRFDLAMIDFLANVCSPLLLTPGRHSHEPQELKAFFVGPGRGDDGDVHAADLLDLVVIHLGKHDLFLDPESIVAAPVEPLRGNPLEVAHAGSAIPISLSRKWYILSRRSVTMTPMGTPSRSLKFAMLLRAFVTTGFWP